MKLMHQKFEKNMEGSVKAIPEEAEDMWHVFNLIREGDRVTATTFRKINRDTGTGAADTERIKLKLTIHVEGIEYDPEGALHGSCGHMRRTKARMVAAAGMHHGGA